MDTVQEPAAWFPMALSLAMIAMIAVALFVVHPAPAADEGTMAHLFQLWLVFEIGSIPYFAFTRRGRKAVALIVAVQIALAAVPIAIVHSLNL
jgi:hypothetical protein